jgi:Rieske Fe-S protein
MTDPAMTDPAPADIGRRVVLLGAGVVGVAGVLAACGGGDDDATSGGGAKSPAASEPAAESEPAPAETTEAPADGGGAAGVVAVADVPVGGGIVIAAEKLVVTQPAEGDFKGFDSTCTHQRCQVAEVADGQIKCPCHGSRYSIEDGSVLGGPAPEPLAEKGVAVEGDQVVLT